MRRRKRKPRSAEKSSSSSHHHRQTVQQQHNHLRQPVEASSSSFLKDSGYSDVATISPDDVVAYRGKKGHKNSHNNGMLSQNRIEEYDSDDENEAEEEEDAEDAEDATSRPVVVQQRQRRLISAELRPESTGKR